MLVQRFAGRFEGLGASQASLFQNFHSADKIRPSLGAPIGMQWLWPRQMKSVGIGEGNCFICRGGGSNESPSGSLNRQNATLCGRERFPRAAVELTPVADVYRQRSPASDRRRSRLLTVRCIDGLGSDLPLGKTLNRGPLKPPYYIGDKPLRESRNKTPKDKLRVILVAICVLLED